MIGIMRLLGYVGKIGATPSRDMGVCDVLEKTLPSVQAIFMEALSAMEARQTKRRSTHACFEA